jgi:NADPH-dependent F420 reductase
MTRRRGTLCRAAMAAALWTMLAATALAESIAMIGTGNVGSALGRRFAEAGHDVVYGSRQPDRNDIRELLATTGNGATAMTPGLAAARADIVVLAVPWDAVTAVVESLGNLTGKIVIDPTNPRVTMSDGFRDYAFDSSNAENVQALAPGASVVKAFSTLGSYTMLDPLSAGGPVTIPIISDDTAAKARVAALVREIGLEPLDVGPLRYARVIEGMHFLRYNSRQMGHSFNYYLMPETVAGE